MTNEILKKNVTSHNPLLFFRPLVWLGIRSQGHRLHCRPAQLILMNCFTQCILSESVCSDSVNSNLADTKVQCMQCSSDPMHATLTLQSGCLMLNKISWTSFSIIASMLCVICPWKPGQNIAFCIYQCLAWQLLRTLPVREAIVSIDTNCDHLTPILRMWMQQEGCS